MVRRSGCLLELLSSQPLQKQKPIPERRLAKQTHTAIINARATSDAAVTPEACACESDVADLESAGPSPCVDDTCGVATSSVVVTLVAIVVVLMLVDDTLSAEVTSLRFVVATGRVKVCSVMEWLLLALRLGIAVCQG
jgi:hypothetical protein